jgi:hypothetical protein
VIKFNYILHLTQNMDGTPMRNVYSQDGEAEILTPAMDWSVQSAFEEARTEFVKGPPSATAAHQANDRSPIFKNTKLGMETVTKNDIDTSNPTLVKHVKVAILALKAEHPQIQLSHANETKMIKAIETLTYVQKNGYVQARKIVMGYEVSCQFPF